MHRRGNSAAAMATDAEDEQLAAATAASLALHERQQHRAQEQQHSVARTDSQEEAAMAVAIAESLAESGGPQHALTQPSPAAPAPAVHQHPPFTQAQQQPGSSTTSAGGGSGREWRLPSPLRMLDSALQKVAGELSGGSCCAGCGRVIGLGTSLTALGKLWHPACFTCAGCGQPVGLHGGHATFSVSQDGQPFHPECYRQLHHPRCYVCGDLIPETGDGRIEWRENPFWKQPHCPAHSVDGTPQCCSCSRLKPVAAEWVGLQDGRLLCLDCVDTLVVDTRDAQPLYDEVLQFFMHMGMRHAYKVPLLLVQGQVLEEYADREGRARQPGAAAGPVFHVRGLCVAHTYTTIPSVVRALGGEAAVSSIHTLLQRPQQHCTVSTLLVMYALPRLLAGSIIAHELMHAYLRMRNVAGLPLQVEEGLCQLMAMLWLDGQDHWANTRHQHSATASSAATSASASSARTAAAPGSTDRGSGSWQQRLHSYLGYQIRTDVSEVYGDGFRIALERFQQRGLRALVEAVIATGDWPQWRC